MLRAMLSVPKTRAPGGANRPASVWTLATSQLCVGEAADRLNEQVIIAAWLATVRRQSQIVERGDCNAESCLSHRSQEDPRIGGNKNPQPLASRYTLRGDLQARGGIPRRMLRLDGWPNCSRRQGQRRARCRSNKSALSERTVWRRRRRAWRSDGCRPPRYRLSAGFALGVHRHLCQGKRRRISRRPLPAGAQGDLGLPWDLYN